MKHAAVLFCLAGLLACSPKVNDPADVQGVKDTLATFNKALNSGNAEGVASGYYAPGAIRMGPCQPAITGREAIRDSFQSYIGQFGEEVRDVVEDVRVSGDLAVARGSYEGTSSLKAGGFATPLKGKWMTAFQRQADGSWKAFWDTFNSDLPAADSLLPGKEEQALMQIERDWLAAKMKDDRTALDRILAAGFVFNLDGLIKTKKDSLEAHKSGAAKLVSAELSGMRALVFGEMAVVHGVVTGKAMLDGKDFSGAYRFTDTFIKRDGRWQALATVGTRVQ